MSDLDDELAALEKEVENEAKMENQKKSGNRNNNSNNPNKNFTNNNPPKQSHKINYEDYGDNSNILESFLSDNNNGYNNNNNKGNNYQSNNYSNNNYANQNNYNQYTNNYNNNYGYNNSNRKMNNNNNNSNRNSNYNQNNQNNRQNINNNPNYNMMKNQNQGYINQAKNNNYNNNQQQAKQSQQSQKQPQIQQQGKQPQVQQQRQSNINKSKNAETNNEPKEDIYPEKQESMYHKVNEMKSLTVLEEEIALCNKIIAFKKKRGLDYDAWETKKDMAEVKLSSTKSLIESGQMDFETYKKLILVELQYENKILKFTEMDKKSKPYELAEIKRRIQQRIDTISKELTQNIEEDGGEGEKEQQKEKEQAKDSNNKKLESSQRSSRNQAQKPINKNNEEIGPQDSANKSKAEIRPPNNNQYHQPQPQPNTPKTQLPQQKPAGQTHQGQMKVPPQYIIQQKVLVKDPKTGKQMYVMKNVVDPKYLEALKKQQALQQQQQQQSHHTQVQDKNPQQHHHHQQPQNQQHIIQQKVLVTDPKTGKQMYVIKNVVDPRYAQAQKQVQQKAVEQKASNQINQKNKVSEKKNIIPADSESEAKPVTNVKQNVKAQPVNNEEKEKYQKYVNTLVKEYTEAKEYFKRCGFEKQLTKCREDLKILLHAKQKIDYKNYKEVKLSALPKPITPEYIFGYTENERMEKFKAVLTQLIKDKNDYEQKMKSILEKLEKLRKKELEKAKDAVKPKLDELKQKKEKTIKLMDGLKEKFKDKWTPAPDYQKVMEQEQVEKVSYEGCKYVLDIKVGKTDYDKDKTFLKLMLELSKSKVLQREVRLKQLGDFNEEWKWEFTADEFKNIPKTFLYVELYREHTFSTDKKGSGKIDLNGIRRGTAIKTDLKLEIESKRVEPIINFIITPVLPQGKKYYETVTKEAIRITKIYPPFTGKQQIESENQSNNKQPSTDLSLRNWKMLILLII